MTRLPSDYFSRHLLVAVGILGAVRLDLGSRGRAFLRRSHCGAAPFAPPLGAEAYSPPSRADLWSGPSNLYWLVKVLGVQYPPAQGRRGIRGCPRLEGASLCRATRGVEEGSLDT